MCVTGWVFEFPHRYSQPWEGAKCVSSLDLTRLLRTTDVYCYVPRKKKQEVPEAVKVLIDAFKEYASNPKELHSPKKLLRNQDYV